MFEARISTNTEPTTPSVEAREDVSELENECAEIAAAIEKLKPSVTQEELESLSSKSSKETIELSRLMHVLANRTRLLESARAVLKKKMN